MLADKLEAFDNFRRSSGPRRHVKASETENDGRQKEKLNLLLKSFQNISEPGGEAATMLEHHINTGNSPPITVPIIPLCKRGRPAKVPQTPGFSSGRRWNLKIRMLQMVLFFIYLLQ
ncbi:UNVERIFIED_CONTAM: hypothetical protein NCL1_60913 [Trichonephila clavipes]